MTHYRILADLMIGANHATPLLSTAIISPQVIEHSAPQHPVQIGNHVVHSH